MIKIALEPGSVDDPWPMLSLPAIQGVVAEAHDRDALVRAHLGRTADTGVLELASQGRVDAVEHVPKPFFSVAQVYEHLLAGALPPLSPDEKSTLTELAEARIILVPTLEAETIWCESPQVPTEKRSACYAFYLDRVRYYHQLNGPIALGNDAGADPILETGMPLKEMQLLHEAGLTNLEVLEAATEQAAAACNANELVGTLEPGKMADIIVVAGDPLSDLSVMEQVALVLLGGEIALQRDSH
jgi:imidazolonepropionase-like amidohydrolase